PGPPRSPQSEPVVLPADGDVVNHEGQTRRTVVQLKNRKAVIQITSTLQSSLSVSNSNPQIPCLPHGCYWPTTLHCSAGPIQDPARQTNRQRSQPRAHSRTSLRRLWTSTTDRGSSCPTCLPQRLS